MTTNPMTALTDAVERLRDILDRADRIHARCLELGLGLMHAHPDKQSFLVSGADLRALLDAVEWKDIEKMDDAHRDGRPIAFCRADDFEILRYGETIDDPPEDAWFYPDYAWFYPDYSDKCEVEGRFDLFLPLPSPPAPAPSKADPDA